MKTLLIRADAFRQVGSGHVLRCLALAQGWLDRGGNVVFLGKIDSASLKTRLQKEGIRLVDARNGAEDAAQTIALAQDLAADWVVVDGYGFDQTYQEVLKTAGLRLLWLDDEGRLGHYSADCILNQNLHATEELYQNREDSTRLLLGSTYVLLRREYRWWADWRRPSLQSVGRLLVTAGGADPQGISLQVVQALERLPERGFETDVVLGPLKAGDPLLKATASRIGGIHLHHQVQDMAELMAKADLAIAAAGSTAWELAFMGLPALLVAVAENQQPVVRELERRGVVQNMGEPHNLQVADWATAIGDLVADPEKLRTLGARGRQVIDGAGVDRVLAILLAERLRLRRVGNEDRRLLFDWANDPEVRASAFSSQPIPWQDHVRWFDRKLASPDCIHYLACDLNDTPVGQVRFDRLETDSVEISVSLAREHRSLGYGSLLLRLAVERLFVETSVKTIHAYIKPHNAASLRAFAKANFVPQGELEVRGHQAQHYLRTKS